MGKISFIIAFLITTISTMSKAQDSTRFYKDAYLTIDSMLTGKVSLSFKKAVFAVENAYLDGSLNYNDINKQLIALKNLVIAFKKSNPIDYTENDKDLVQTNASIFKILTDSIPIFMDTSHLIIHIPYSYDFEDMWGRLDWTKMFVSKLLRTQKGNCHSLPYLYKILAEELNVPAYLSFAPNHIYIKLYCKKTGWYNTELTSATFPIDAWIMASGYVHLDAIRNGLYMDTLNMQQSIAYCLLDLAQGYQFKFGKSNPDFVLKCCEIALKFNPVNVNILLTKAEAQKYFIDTKMKEQNAKKPKELFGDNSIKVMYANMEETYVRLHQLGYRRMPEKMYMEWMSMLKNNPEKYTNDKVIHKFDNR